LRIGILNGPNLNLLGRRDPAHYGRLSLEEIGRLLEARAADNGDELIHTQSNHEGVLIDWIQKHMDEVDGWLVNPAALGHTSYALRDALEASAKPFVEVHLSAVSEREPFRRRSVLTDIAVDVVAGLKADSYLVGLDTLVAHLARKAGPVE
jgi:3-dehydroquinate dehydratase-2